MYFPSWIVVAAISVAGALIFLNQLNLKIGSLFWFPVALGWMLLCWLVYFLVVMKFT